MNLLPMHIFIIACISHWETISLLSNVALPDVDIFHYQVGLYQVISQLLVSPLRHQKILSTGELSSSWCWIQVFQNSNICLKT